MKSLILPGIILIMIAGFASCNLDNLNPTPPPVPTRTDTSTTVIDDTSLVGTWNIVTDSISSGLSTMYHGKPGDHYTFTKYGNIYINSGFHSYIDTGVYTVSANRVQWVNSFTSVDGVVSRLSTTAGVFTITGLTANTLTLTQSTSAATGPYYEQIVFTK